MVLKAGERNIYKKIESRILSLKEKEELWKSRYRELAQQLKELVDSNSEKMSEMEKSIANFEERIEMMEETLAKIGKKTEESFRLMDKRISSLSEMAKNLSEKLSEKDAEIKKTRTELSSQINTSKYEEMFKLMDKKISSLSEMAKNLSEKIEERDSEMRKLRVDVKSQIDSLSGGYEKKLEKSLSQISEALNKMEEETRKAELVYEKLSTLREFVSRAGTEKPVPEKSYSGEAETKTERKLPAPPQPERTFSRPVEIEPVSGLPEPPFTHGSPAPRKFFPRFVPETDEMDDIDFDVDDLIEKHSAKKTSKMEENVEEFKSSVEEMNNSVSSIAERIASLENAISKMQVQKPADLDRIEEKIQVYAESVADARSRMETVEKALKDGLTPMMEAMKMLTDAVKELKEERKKTQKQKIQKPLPPEIPKDAKPNESLPAPSAPAINSEAVL